MIPDLSTCATHLEAALAYGRAGFAVFPVYGIVDGACGCGAAGCRFVGKHGIERLGYRAATTDPGQITAWWSGRPDLSIGLNMEASGLLGFDIDADPRGRDRLALLIERFGPALTDTLLARSGSGAGWHVVFRTPPGFVWPRKPKSACDGLVSIPRNLIVEPSIHASGGAYRWLIGEGRTREVALLPPALAASISQPSSTVPFSPAWRWNHKHDIQNARRRSRVLRGLRRLFGNRGPTSVR